MQRTVEFNEVHACSLGLGRIRPRRCGRRRQGSRPEGLAGATLNPAVPSTRRSRQDQDASPPRFESHLLQGSARAASAVDDKFQLQMLLGAPVVACLRARVGTSLLPFGWAESLRRIHPHSASAIASGWHQWSCTRKNAGVSNKLAGMSLFTFEGSQTHYPWPPVLDKWDPAISIGEQSCFTEKLFSPSRHLLRSASPLRRRRLFGGFGWGWHNLGYDWRHDGRVVFNHNTYISHSRTIVNRNSLNGSRANFNHGADSHGRSFASHTNAGTHSSAFSGFNHGGLGEPIPSGDSPALAASMEAAKASTAEAGTVAGVAGSSHEVIKP